MVRLAYGSSASGVQIGGIHLSEVSSLLEIGGVEVVSSFSFVLEALIADPGI